MGLEIRQVPEDWQHPSEHNSGQWNRNEASGRYLPERGGHVWRPLYDESWVQAARKYLLGWIKWSVCGTVAWPLAIAGLLDLQKYNALTRTVKYGPYQEYAGKFPDPFYYRPHWRDGERTCLQLYETVSEGTPLSPPMPDAESLAEWLEGRDVWHGAEDMSKDDWLKFMANGGWAPSGVYSRERGFQSGVEWAVEQEAQGE